MSEARQAALTEIDGLLALAGTGRLGRAACRQLVTLAPAVPGRVRRIVATLGQQRDADAVEALLGLASGTPGVIEAVFGALHCGVARSRADRSVCPRMLALEFRSSNSRRFPALVERASAAFGTQLERIRVDGKLHYRFALFEHDGESSLRERAMRVELDIERLHHDLARLRGVRLWLNGWCFDDDGPIAPRSRAALLSAWFAWVRDSSEQRTQRL